MGGDQNVVYSAHYHSCDKTQRGAGRFQEGPLPHDDEVPEAGEGVERGHTEENGEYDECG